MSKTVSAAGKLVKNSSNSDAEESGADVSAASGVATAVSNDITDVPPPSLHTLSEPQLREWLKQEARDMDLTTNDTEQTQIRLRAQAQTLTPVQMRHLVKAARDTESGVNQRILSAYMISLNTSTASVDSLYELAQSTPPDHGPSIPHTDSEVKNAQELALRYMQIDELAARAAQRDSNAHDKLNLLSRQGGSPQVRSYAQRKLSELK